MHSQHVDQQLTNLHLTFLSVLDNLLDKYAHCYVVIVKLNVSYWVDSGVGVNL